MTSSSWPIPAGSSFVPAPLRDSELFQAELGRISADLRAAQAFLDAQVAGHWRHALAGTLKDDALLAQGIQAAIWIAAACIRVADACFTQAGSIALYETSPLQRRMRDLHVAAQHFSARPRNYVSAGKLLFGRNRRQIGDRGYWGATEQKTRLVTPIRPFRGVGQKWPKLTFRGFTQKQPTSNRDANPLTFT